MTILYTRVSTNRQASNGESLRLQMDKLKAYSKLKGLGAGLEVSDEGFTGKNSERPGFKRLMRYVKSNQANHVVVYSISRFGRNTREVLQAIDVLTRHNTTFHSLNETIDTSTAMGKFALTLFAALAQLESDTTSERIKEMHQHIEARGGKMGQAPFGYKLNEEKVLVEVLDEQETIGLVTSHRSLGWSYEKICEMLIQSNRKNKAGNVSWYPSQIQRILKRHENRD